MVLKYTLDSGAFAPVKAHEADAGIDLKTPADVIVPARGSAMIDTGIHVAIPNGFTGFIKSKSGLNVKHGLEAEGVIDSEYTGSVVVKMYNHSDEPYSFIKGDKLTQLVILPIPPITLVNEEILERTDRGDKGFGSSGR